jgi:cell division protein FtsN
MAQTPQLPGSIVVPHPVQTSLAVPLAVKVGSFTVKSNADALVVSLIDLGYRPMISQFEDPYGRQWYLVKLGPYNRWNAASAVAARVAIAENVRPIIGPMQ